MIDRAVVFALLFALCACKRQPYPDLPLRGPLVALVGRAPASLETCERRTTTYAEPFWRAPYLACGYSVGGEWREGFDVDADSVVVSVERSAFRIQTGDRDAAFRHEAKRLAAVSAPQRATWDRVSPYSPASLPNCASTAWVGRRRTPGRLVFCSCQRPMSGLRETSHTGRSGRTPASGL